jgi:hypothetical protein
MHRICSIILFLLLDLAGSYTAVAQDNGAFSTKRDSPIGVVSFGPSVTSGVLGDIAFVDGYVKKNGSDLFVFPVGDNGVLRPFSLASDQALGAYYGVDPGVAVTSNPLGGDYGVLPEGGPFNRASLGAGLAAISSKEYWDINGTAPSMITLSWNANSDINGLLTNRALIKLTIAGWDGTKWVNLTASVDNTSIFGQLSNATSGSITTLVEIVPDTYNVYTLAAIRDDALPVELVSFTGAARERASYLEWLTSAEINSSHFGIERSGDAKTWQLIGKVAARGDEGAEVMSRRYGFVDDNALDGSNYYRLKMVDRAVDGKDEAFAYSRIVKVDITAGPEFTVFPNPVSEKLFFSKTIMRSLSSARLTDPGGRTMYASREPSADGIDVSGMPAGLYMLKFSFTDGLSKSYKVLISR